MKELIVSAAVNAYGAIWSLPRPARHHDVLRAIDEAGLSAIAPGPDAQGFLTSDGRFVDRKAAVRIALDAEQIKEPQWPPDLYSEDLW
jgi:aryl-alcohol dehydrogenase-like predicted oxidoreductase